MKKYQVFIDGEHGTTGLEIRQRLECHSDVEIIHLKDAYRKDLIKRKEIIEKADISFLCLPDKASIEMVSLLNENCRIIDTSTAHRLSPNFIYGLPELEAGRRERIREAKRVSVPGCHALAFILGIKPLIEAGLLNKDIPPVVVSVTGYSGGGKSMINKYETLGQKETISPAIYATKQKHKHLPEMERMSGLTVAPVFLPILGNFYKGLMITISLAQLLRVQNMNLEEIYEIYKKYYLNEALIKITLTEEEFIFADEIAGSDYAKISIYGNPGRPLVSVSIDNLGKGASGTAIQCMNIMLDLEEREGLRIG